MLHLRIRKVQVTSSKTGKHIMTVCCVLRACYALTLPLDRICAIDPASEGFSATINTLIPMETTIAAPLSMRSTSASSPPQPTPDGQHLAIPPVSPCCDSHTRVLRKTPTVPESYACAHNMIRTF